MNFDIRHSRQSPLAFPLGFRRDPMGTIRDLAALGGDGVIVPSFRGRLVFLNHPDLLREVLIERNDAFIKARGLQLARYLLGDGLLTSEEPYHGKARKLILPAFHHTRLMAYGDVMVRRASETADTWRDGDVIDAYPALMEMTLEIAAETLFGADIGSDVSRVSQALSATMMVFERVTNPFARLLHYLPTPGTIRFRGAIRTLDDIVYRFIRERRGSGVDVGDLLSMLLSAQEEETGAGLTDQQVRDEAVTLLLAGHETTAVALTWTLWLLGTHPDIQQELHREAVEATREGPSSGEHVKRLPLTRQAFAEGMRLYPPGWLLGRQAKHATSIGGEPIPKDATLLFSPYMLHRDARWWDDPGEFRPNRFTVEAKRDRHKFAYLPFSAGQRGCIGEPFAWMEGVLVLATLLKRWRFEAEGSEPALYPSITLRPAGPVRLRVVRRL